MSLFTSRKVAFSLGGLLGLVLFIQLCVIMMGGSSSSNHIGGGNQGGGGNTVVVIHTSLDSLPSHPKEAVEELISMKAALKAQEFRIDQALKLIAHGGAAGATGNAAKSNNRQLMAIAQGGLRNSNSNNNHGTGGRIRLPSNGDLHQQHQQDGEDNNGGIQRGKGETLYVGGGLFDEWKQLTVRSSIKGAFNRTYETPVDRRRIDNARLYPAALRHASSHRKSFARIFDTVVYELDVIHSQATLPVPAVKWHPELYQPSDSVACVRKFGKLTQASTEYGTHLQLTPELVDCIGHFSGEKQTHAKGHWEDRAVEAAATHPLGNIIHGGIHPPRIMAQSFAFVQAGGLRHVVDGARNDIVTALEADYHAYQAHKPLTAIVDLARRKKNITSLSQSVVVELGSGNGNLLYSMCPPHPLIRCYGTDIASAMIQTAQTYIPWIDFRVGIGAGHIPSGSADLVLSNAVAFYLTAQQLCTHVAEGLRLLRPGGKMVMSGIGPNGLVSRTYKNFFKTEDPATGQEILMPFCGAAVRKLVSAAEPQDQSKIFTMYIITDDMEKWLIPVITRSEVPFCTSTANGQEMKPHEGLLQQVSSAAAGDDEPLANNEVMCPTDESRDAFAEAHPFHDFLRAEDKRNFKQKMPIPEATEKKIILPYSYVSLLTEYMNLYDWYSHATSKNKAANGNKFWHVMAFQRAISW